MTAVDEEAAVLTEEELAAKEDRKAALRAKYRTLPDIEARQRAIYTDELPKISGLDEPDEGDLAWQETLIQEHDDLDDLAAPLRKRAAALDRVMKAHADPANREEVAVRSTPDLATRSVIGQDPFREMERVERGLVEPQEIRGRAQDAIEMYSKRGDLAHDFAENANALASEQFWGTSNIARHILETGSPDYYDAFRAYLSDPGKYSARAALTLTSANGGYLLPFVLDRLVA